MIILTMFSPPDTNGIITQAMAIQAHQPDLVIFLDVKLNNSNIKFDGKQRLEAWIQGSEDLLSLFSDLDQPYPFLITPPKGYISRNGILPKLITKSCKKEDIKDIFENLTNEYSGEELRFDFLPGAKMLKFPLLVTNEIKLWKICFTLESGKIISYEGENQLQLEGLPLSIIDRCWLSDYPVHVENKHSFFKEKKEIFEEIFKCLSIEQFNEDKIIAKKTSMQKKPLRKIVRLILIPI